MEVRRAAGRRRSGRAPHVTCRGARALRFRYQTVVITIRTAQLSSATSGKDTAMAKLNTVAAIAITFDETK
jgi:hypothetical protein